MSSLPDTRADDSISLISAQFSAVGPLINSFQTLKQKNAKARDKQNALDSIESLLQDNDIQKELNQNSILSKRNNLLTWNVVFVQMESYFDAEISKGKVSEQRKLSLFSLVQSIVKRANSTYPYLEMITIFRFIDNTCSNDAHISTFASGLINLMNDFIKVNHYRATMSKDQWKKILGYTMKVFGIRALVSKDLVIDTLNKVITLASSCPTLLAILRNQVVEFFFSNLESSENGVSTKARLIQGSVLLCRYNAVESRHALCKFGEDLIPHLLNNTSLVVEDETGKMAMIDFLTIQIKLHHPFDVAFNSDGFYSADPQNWRSIVQDIYMYSYDSIEQIVSKKTLGYLQVEKISPKLYSLFVKITKHATDLEVVDNASNPGEGPSNKRQMSSRTISSIIGQATMLQPSEGQLIWVEYIKSAISCFPDLVEEKPTFMTLFQMGLALLDSRFVDCDDVFGFFLVLLNHETHMITKGLLQERSKSWNDVWNIATKFVTRQTKSTAHIETKQASELIQQIIVHVQPPDIDSLLNLFLSESLTLTKTTLHLLAVFLMNCTLPQTKVEVSKRSTMRNGTESEKDRQVDSPRTALVNWLLTSKTEKPLDGFEQEMATILCSLLVRKTHILIQNTYSSTTSSKTQAVKYGEGWEDEEFEETLLTSSFVKLPSTAKHTSSYDTANEGTGVFVLHNETATYFIHQLQQDAVNIPQPCRNPDEFLKRLKFLQNRASLLLNVLSTLVRHQIINTSEVGNWLKTKCEDLFVRFINEYEIGISLFLAAHSENLELVNALLQVMGSFWKFEHLCTEARQLLAAYYPDQLTEFLWKAFRSGLSKHAKGDATRVMPFAQDVFAVKLWKDLEKLTNSSLEALKCLLQFGRTSKSNSNSRSNFFGEILDDLNAEDFFNLNISQFDLCEEYVRNIIPILHGGKSLYNRLFELLQKMCRVYFTNSECNARLWNLFAALTPVVARDPEDTEAELLRRKLMRLVGGFSVKLMDSNINVCKTAFEMLSILAQNDPVLNWSWFMSKDKHSDSETYTQILTTLSSMLRNKSHAVRMLTIKTVQEVFLSSSIISSQFKIEWTNQSVEKRKKLYTQFHEDLLNASNEKGIQPDDMDEKSNRTSLVLSSLAKTIFAYPFEQRRVLFSMLLFVKLKSVDIFLACRALEASNPHFAKVTKCHISYLVCKWIKMEYKLEQFPFQFLGCSNFSNFCDEFKQEIAVQLFEHNQTEPLNAFACCIGMSPQNLIKECYGTLVGRLSPHLAMLKGKEAYSTIPKHINQANETNKRLMTLLGGKSLAESLMLVSLGDVILNMISLTYQANITDVWGCPEVVLPEPEPPFHDEDSICVGLQLLKESSSQQEVDIIGQLLLTSPKSIYKILLTLLGRVHNAHDHLDKYWRLHQYSFFVKLLLAEPQDVFDCMKEFLCQFLVYSYMRFLQTKEDERFLGCVLRLALFCFVKLIDLCLTEMQIHFRFIISRLVTRRLKSPGLNEVIQEALRFLLVSNGGRFANCITALDPFPEIIGEDIFHEFRQICTERKYNGQGSLTNETQSNWNLCKELETSLEDVEVSKNVLPKEKLRFLKQLLASRKSELELLVSELEDKRFMDECKDNIIHKLLRQLVAISMHSKDQATVLEASRCLGEIGAIDLSVLVMPPFGRKSKITSMITAIPSIIESIVCYLTDDDFETVISTGKVLQSLLEVTECAQTVNTEIKPNNYRIFSLLIPFMSSNATARSSGKVNEKLLETKLNFDCFNENMDYSEWVRQFTCGLIAPLHPEGLASRLVPLCKQKVEFCEDIIPFIVFYLLYSGRSNPTVRNLIGSYIQQFLNHFKSLEEGRATQRPAQTVASLMNGKNLNSIYHNKLALRCLLGIVQFLREHTIPAEMKENSILTPWDNNFWLDLNYLDLAKAAQFCGAYLTSILYSEIYAFWCNESDTSLAENDEFYSQETTSFPQSRNQAEQIETLFLKAYATIGEPDAIYGCGPSRLYDFDSNIQYLQQMKKWERSLCLYDSQPSSYLGICKSMKEIGLYETLWTYMQGIGDIVSRGDSNLMDIQYECGWRLSKWDLNSNKTTYLTRATNQDKLTGPTMRNKFVFESIQNGLSGDSYSLERSIQSGFRNIVEALRHASLESSANLYGFLSDMQCLCTVEEYFSQPQTQEWINGLTEKWRLHDQVGFSDFKYEEPILYLRNILLNCFRQKYPSSTIDKIYDDSIYQLVHKAREAGRIELAEKSATKFLDDVNKTRKHVEIARNHCARGDQDLACHLIKRIVDKTPCQSLLYPSVLLLKGEWLFQTQSERPVAIIETMLMKACHYYEVKKASYDIKEIAKAHLTVAKYADAQYQNICNYVKSDMFTEKASQLQKAKEEQNLTEAAKSDKARVDEIKKSQGLLRKQAHIDQAEMNTTYLEKKRFLLFALRHYLRGLIYSSDHDLLIFRAIGLWLERADYAQDDVAREANKLMVDAKLPSIKYIMVLHQLSARMGVNNVAVNATLTEILTTCAKEHPYQALPVLLTQALLHKDKEIRSKREEGNVADRVKAARTLVNTLKKFKDLSGLICKMEEVWEALIDLANVKEASNEVQTKIMQPNIKLMKLKDMQRVHVPIAHVPSTIVPNQLPPDFPGIDSFGSTFQLVGGINSPRRISCTGTNGRKYDMLLKGHDDLRQDALMQQVFGVMNELLRLEPRTKIRRLQIRTYKVVPLSQRSGIIEWCQNTQTFGDYLTGSQKDSGAHALYRPNDYRPNECRKKMSDVKDSGDNKKKVDVFLDIIDHFKPVFRHFFLENFKDAGAYFERRLAYTRSVATSSMVGYILGLGDRHVLNILVDRTTAEFIHIDLGVAFEQGRILPTPETIPFRLTRDVVDGMGVAGVEGVFRRSAEMTLEVLRNNSEIILTILEVLLYDPLYIWTLTADRMQKVQPGDSAKQGRRSSVNQSEIEFAVPKERNNSAARVLLRLKQKLLGIEEGSSSGSSLSVPGHVSLLIQKAVDPDLLSRVFPGWQPYL